MTVLDRDVLVRLGSDIQDCEFAISFASRYCSMLTTRVQRIVDALKVGDFVAAMDAVLSLKTSSTTVGTHELARLAREVEMGVRARDLAMAREHASRLADAADRAHEALADYLAAYRAG